MDDHIKFYLSRYDTWDDCPKCWQTFVMSLKLSDSVQGSTQCVPAQMVWGPTHTQVLLFMLLSPESITAAII